MLSELFTEDVILNLFKNLDPVSFKYNGQKKDLIHFGFLANKIKDIFENNNIDASKYSIIEEIEEEVVDEETHEKHKETILTLKYEEIIPILFLIIKILLRELNNINTRIENLEEENK